MQMLYGAQNDVFWFKSSFDEKAALKKADCKFHPYKPCPGVPDTVKAWWTDSYEIARLFRSVASEHAAVKLDVYTAARDAAIAASRADDAAPDCPDLPVPDGLEYRPFQRAGIAYALSHPSVLFADEMGLGKTIQVIGAINADLSLRRVLVVCPSSLKQNWANELVKWLVRKYRIEIAQGGTFAPWLEASWQHGLARGVAIINYDILRRHHDVIRSIDWDLLVADECHYLKNPRTGRTQQVFGTPSTKRVDEDSAVEPIRATRRMMLTGTPIPNRVMECWGVNHFLSPEVFSSWFKFATHFAGGNKGGWGWEWPKRKVDMDPSTMRELQDLMRSSHMIRRKKSEVLKELPPKTRQVIVLDADACARRSLKAERAVVARNSALRDDARRRVELTKAAHDIALYDAAVLNMRDVGRVAFQEMSLVRAETARAKIPQVVKFLADTLESTDKVVVFCHHREVVDALVAEARILCKGVEPAVIDGRVPVGKRQGIVDRFQDEPSCRVFIGSITVAGVGITLTAASTVIFAELDWVPANMTQAEDRLHRIGQEDNVLVLHLVVDGSLDARMATALIEKQAISDACLDDQDVSEKLPEVSSDLPADPDDVPPATAATPRARIQREGAKMSPTQIAAVHEALRLLAGMCDGALVQDGAGFNKLDTTIGHDLAVCATLSGPQAALGRRIVEKYRAQYDAELLARVRGEES